MKKLLQFALICTFGYQLSAQTNVYKEEMIESGEKAVKPEYQKSTDDYKSFLRSRAWKVGAATSSIFTNPADLDIPSIGGRVRSVLVDKTNNISLVAPSGGGLWTFNPTDGSNFNAIDDLGSFLPITDIAQDPNNPQHILVGTGDEIHNTVGNGLFESTDGGQTFSVISSTEPDGSNGYNYIRFVRFEPGSSTTLYIASGDKLYKSTNSGFAWTEVYDGSGGIRSIDFYKNNKIVISVANDGFYASATGNLNSFAKQSTGLPANVTTALISVHAANRDIAYGFFIDNDTQKGIYKTTNGGNNWIKQGDVTFSTGQAWFSVALGVHPTNPNILFAGSIGAGFSTDGGVTWNANTDFEVDFHSVHFNESAPDVAYVGYDQGFGSIDFGNSQEVTEWQVVNGQWEQVTYDKFNQIELGKKPGFNTTQIYYGDYFPEAYGDAYIEGQQDGGSFGSTANRQTRIRVGDGGSVFINKQSPNNAMASTQRGRIGKATDATTPNYTDYNNAVDGILNDHPHFITQFAGNNADGNQVYMLSNSQLKRTKDFGTTFTDIAAVDKNSDGFSSGIVAVQNAVNPVVYVVCNKHIIVVNNAATSPSASTKMDVLDQTWVWGGPLPDGNPDRVTVDPNNPYTIYVTTTRGKAYKVSALNTNSPVKEDIKGDIPDVNFNSVKALDNEANVLIAGTNVGLYFSLDAGTTWTLSNEIPHTQVTDLKYRVSDKRLFVFTYGRGAWATTIDLNVVGLADKLQSQIIVSPNPATDFVSVSSENQEIEKMIVYDVSGNEVASGVDQIVTSHLTEGTYIVHALDSQNKIIGTEKISIVK